MKMTKNIGTLTGEILVFGGVYSNLEALIAIKEIADAACIPAQNIICTGDVVAYCADAEACVQMVKNWGIHVIAGNVELQLRNGEDNCGCEFNENSRCDIFSRNWYPYAKEQLSSDSINWMHDLPDFLTFEYASKKVTVVHGSYHHVSEYIFASTDWTIKRNNFIDSNSDIILAGHCGLPFNQSNNNQLWLNSGVIGMPANDGTTRVWYAVLNDVGQQFSFIHHSLKTDFTPTIEKMLTHRLPHEYAHTLKTGLWDNCEILPSTETTQRGIEIDFSTLKTLA